MGLFTKRIGTVFLKETSDTSEYIEKLEELKKQAPDEVKKRIEKQISNASYGERGEQNIAFQLKNSGLDMYVLHDIFLMYGEMSAQIDYLVITRKHVYVIECKNLYGNIEIDNKGTFIRNCQIGGKWIKEGMESPITQNQRHMLVLKELRKSSKGNFLTKMLFEKNFESTYKSIVVLANSKTILNDRFAKKEIKEQVIRADQLIEYIKNTDAMSNDSSMNDEAMLNLAQFYLENNQRKKSDYTLQYQRLLQEIEEEVNNQENPEVVIQDEATEVTEVIEPDMEELIKRLKSFRLEQSRKEGIKPYYIFNDAQMNDLLQKSPKSKEDLLKVSGFGNVKVEKYGDRILKILNKEGQ